MAKSKSEIRTLVDARLHVLYCGVTQSGKTTLARHHARLLSRAGYDVAVYDPVMTETAGGGWPENVRMFDDADKFVEWLSKASYPDDRPCFVFVDESPDVFGHANGYAVLLPRRVRHQNVYLRIISQRPKMLPPNVRSQCAHCYLFRLAADDARMICADFGHGSDVAQIQLDSGDFILLVSGSSAIEQFNCFDLVD